MKIIGKVLTAIFMAMVVIAVSWATKNAVKETASWTSQKMAKVEWWNKFKHSTKERWDKGVARFKKTRTAEA
jgi:hypothetical protein